MDRLKQIVPAAKTSCAIATLLCAVSSCDKKPAPGQTSGSRSPTTAAPTGAKTVQAKPTAAPTAAPTVDNRPDHIKKLDGADEPPKPIKPGEKLTLNIDQIAPSFLGRFFVTGAAGSYVLRITARGTSCVNPDDPKDKPKSMWPVIELLLDGTPSTNWFIDSKDNKEFETDAMELDASRHTLELIFVNDYVDNKKKCDRNVWLDTVELAKPSGK